MRVRYRNPRRSLPRRKEEKVEEELGVTRRGPGRVWYCGRCVARTGGLPVHSPSTTCLNEPAGCGNWRTNISDKPRSTAAKPCGSNQSCISHEFRSPRRGPFQSRFATKPFHDNPCDKSCRSTAKHETRHHRCGLRVQAVQKSEWV